MFSQPMERQLEVKALLSYLPPNFEKVTNRKTLPHKKKKAIKTMRLQFSFPNFDVMLSHVP